MPSTPFSSILVATAMMTATMMPLQLTTATPLDDYVNTPDPHYSWVKLGWEYRGPDFTLYVINMTSQKWLTQNDSSQPVWWHYLYVAVPDAITRPNHGSLYISNGGNSDNFVPDIGSDEFIQFITLMAASTGSVSANLRQVPNQPIIFNNDPTHMRRSEDAVIAWTWYQFITNNADPQWLLRLPMTKAAVRAMDTMAAFTKTLNPDVRMSKFLVCGESKRGWTTWTTAAVDKRVVGIAPMVMDMLNLVPNMHHHYRSLGGWTFAFNDYYETNLTRNLDSPRTQAMADIIDPYAYRDRLTMPKYVISTGGDELFIPDDSYYYLAGLPGHTYLRTIPNAEHSLTLHRPSIFLACRAFFLSVMDNTRRPKLTWTKTWTQTGATLTLLTDTKPKDVDVEYARTIDGNSRRDFRLYTANGVHPVIWYKTAVNVTQDGREYTATFNNPETGWVAFHIHVFFDGPEESDFEFTTENLITPNTFPFQACQGDGCYGRLV